MIKIKPTDFAININNLYIILTNYSKICQMNQAEVYFKLAAL